MSKRWITLLIACILLGGCAATTKPMYDWEGYSQSLYKYKKNETPENMEAHKQVLVNIIEHSKENGLRVPPGVCCEYGYLLVKEGKVDEGMTYISMEKQTYPESSVFIERLQGNITEGKESK
ncbi:putative lipoprotein [Syntrophobacter sp. SbD1]|nr:putative lipoprotein [Syntrophobacter sp. SbD1]